MAPPFELSAPPPGILDLPLALREMSMNVLDYWTAVSAIIASNGER